MLNDEVDVDDEEEEIFLNPIMSFKNFLFTTYE